MMVVEKCQFVGAWVSPAPRMSLQNKRATECLQHIGGPEHQHLAECQMSLIRTTPGIYLAQPHYIDPLVAQARFINEAAALDRALAMRKAVRLKGAYVACREVRNAF